MYLDPQGIIGCLWDVGYSMGAACFMLRERDLQFIAWFWGARSNNTNTSNIESNNGRLFHVGFTCEHEYLQLSSHHPLISRHNPYKHIGFESYRYLQWDVVCTL